MALCIRKLKKVTVVSQQSMREAAVGGSTYLILLHSDSKIVDRNRNGSGALCWLAHPSAHLVGRAPEGCFHMSQRRTQHAELSTKDRQVDLCGDSRVIALDLLRSMQALECRPPCPRRRW